MVPVVGDDGGGGGGAVPDLERFPSTLAGGGKGQPDLLRHDLQFQCLRCTVPDEVQMEPSSGT